MLKVTIPGRQMVRGLSLVLAEMMDLIPDHICLTLKMERQLSHLFFHRKNLISTKHYLSRIISRNLWWEPATISQRELMSAVN